MAEEPRILRGTVVRLYCQTANFCAGRIIPEKGQVASQGEVAFAGKAFVREGEIVALKGEFQDDEKWGRQWKVIERVHEGPATPLALAAWLTVHGAAHGIGKVKAKRIADEFGDDFAGWLRDNPEQIAIACNVPLDTVRALAVSWEDHQGYNAVGMKLSIWELTKAQIETLYKKFKGSIVALLEENPYLLIGEVHRLGFKKIDKIALRIGVPKTHPGRIGAAITFALKEAENDGSTCAIEANHRDAVAEVLGEGDREVLELIEARTAELVTSGKVKREQQAERAFLALPWNWRDERAIANFLAGAGCNPSFPDGPPDGWEQDQRFKDLDESQLRAVATVLRNRVSLISGGAGAGKSWLIAAIANFYRDRDLTVELAAPTGKAARRLEEVAPGFTASTIHRMLRYSPVDGFQHGENCPLSADVVIIDETSMLSSDLAHSLFSAIGSGTSLVLVGDHNQLPPVGAGALLRDAIAHELLPMALLAQCHRQAGHLKQNCMAILHGTVPPTVEHKGQPGPGPWYVLRNLHTPEVLLKYVETLYLGILVNRLGFEPLRDIQFLTPIHAGPIGTKAINILLQRLYQASIGVTVDVVDPEKRPAFYIGDKVIQTKNNYQLDIMNGNQGVVLTVAPLTIDFDGKVVAIPNDCKGEVELGYCLTPHKFQGSETPCAVVICHKVHSFMTHRNWLYTSVTRSRKTCVILGDPDGIDRAAKRLVNNQRRTLLPIFAAARDSGTEQEGNGSN